MSLGHYDEVVLQVHTICRHARRDTHTLALAEEECGRITHLHPGEVDAQTAIGAGTKGTESAFGCCALLLTLKPAGGVVSG